MTLHDIQGKLREKILALFPYKRTDYLSHYTSLDILWKFLDPMEDLLCTYCRSLSDTTEFKTGMYALIRILREMEGGSNTELIEQLRTCVGLSGESGLNWLPWVFSFSVTRDEGYMWKAYTDKEYGGCSICFRQADLCNAIRRKENNDWTLISLLPCIYVGWDEQSKLVTLFKYAIDDVAKDLMAILEGNGLSEDNGRIAKAVIFLLLASVIKHKDFKDEQEWRLIIQPVNVGELGKQVRFTGGKLRVATGLFDMNNNIASAIEKIVISPHGPSEFLEDTAKMICALRNIGNKVVLSESPYKGK